MKVIIKIPTGNMRRVNQNLYNVGMTHTHLLGHRVDGPYIIIRPEDLETVKKVFDKLSLSCHAKFF